MLLAEAKGTCAYCHQPKPGYGLHYCKEESFARIDEHIAAIKRNMERPGSDPVTSNQLRERANSRRAIATTIKMRGGQVRPEHE